MSDRVIADHDEGADVIPVRRERDEAHRDPDWFQRDLDDEFDDPDDEMNDRMPTERHRLVVPKQ